ncbi:hypothetical protein B0T19DRAFT_426464 [Cercophora scortea]|uniref:Secreted protein n=1 Tax=Cercophora scortea TaxID=314031 RepID=A0AAE0IEE3_9PEZI|nr:hypothetical protein B0T19DRAFT_426464 [Cercophora scortea]
MYLFFTIFHHLVFLFSLPGLPLLQLPLFPPSSDHHYPSMRACALCISAEPSRARSVQYGTRSSSSDRFRKPSTLTRRERERNVDEPAGE